MEKIRVSSKSNCNKVAGAITNIIKDFNEIEVQTIGAGALNQLIKSVIISRGYLAPLGINIVCVPSFSEIKINNITKTGIKMLIKAKEKFDF